MAAPSLLNVDPGDSSVGVPIGQQLVLSFDRGIDTRVIRDYLVLFGADFDLTSGPDQAMWVDKDTGDNPLFLHSPGFKGVVDIQTRVVYYDLDTDEDLGTPVFSSEAEELSYGVAGAGHRVYITPKNGELAADVEYTLHVLGDPDTQGTGISARTVFDVVPDGGNASDTGVVYVLGGYTGDTADTLNVEITTAGDIGVAKYKYWFTSAGSSSAKRDKLSNRRYRMLDQGLQIRFSGVDFALGDVFTAALEPAQRMATSTIITFTTNDGSYSLPPDSPSIPATSEPPSTVIPPLPGADTSTSYLQVEEMTPADGAFNVSKKVNTIEILFSEQLDGSTIDQDSIRIWKLPALGYYQGQKEPVELKKKITTVGSLVTLEF